MEIAGSDDIVIRTASDRDVRGVVALAYELLLFHGRLGADWVRPVGSLGEFSDAWESYLIRFLSSSISLVLVAERDGALVGYLMATQHERPPIMVGPPDLMICELAVAESLRGQGVGRRLLDEAEAWGQAEGTGYLRLHVYEANVGAIRFYEREGFTTHERVLLRPIPIPPPSS